MKSYLKLLNLALGITVIAANSSTHAENPTLNFTLQIVGKNNTSIRYPQIRLSEDSTGAPISGSNTFALKVTPSDAAQLNIQYSYNSQKKSALCKVNGTPREVIAIIDPTKEGSEACETSNN